MPTPGSNPPPPRSEFVQPPRQAGVRTVADTRTQHKHSKNQCVHRGSFALISSGACDRHVYGIPNVSKQIKGSKFSTGGGGGRNR